MASASRGDWSWTALCAAQTGAELLGGGVNGNTTGGMLAVLAPICWSGSTRTRSS